MLRDRRGLGRLKTFQMKVCGGRKRTDTQMEKTGNDDYEG